jgi:hypothetical protein
MALRAVANKVVRPTATGLTTVQLYRYLLLDNNFNGIKQSLPGLWFENFPEF